MLRLSSLRGQSDLAPAQLVEDLAESKAALESAHAENANLRQAYADICGEANVLLQVR